MNKYTRKQIERSSLVQLIDIAEEHFEEMTVTLSGGEWEVAIGGQTGNASDSLINALILELKDALAEKGALGD